MNLFPSARLTSWRTSRAAACARLCRGLLLLGLCAVPLRTARAATTDIAGPPGSVGFGSTVTYLSNGNFVVTDSHFSTNGLANVGAVYLYNGTTLALISTLTGSTANDQVGYTVTALNNGNYVVASQNWSGGKGAAT